MADIEKAKKSAKGAEKEVQGIIDALEQDPDAAARKAAEKQTRAEKAKVTREGKKLLEQKQKERLEEALIQNKTDSENIRNLKNTIEEIQGEKWIEKWGDRRKKNIYRDIAVGLALILVFIVLLNYFTNKEKENLTMNDTISSESPTPTPTPTPTKQIIAIPISVSTPTTTITFPPTPTSTLSPTLNPTATLMSTPIPKQKVYTGIGKSLHFKPGDTVVGWSIRIGTSFYKGGRVVLYDSPCEGIVTSGIINPDEWEITGETVITRDEILK